MANNNPPKPRSGLSLYSNLLHPQTTPGVISSGPIPSDQLKNNKAETAAKKPQVNPAFMKFPPLKRPLQQNKNKPKAVISRPPVPSTAAKGNDRPSATATPATAAAPAPRLSTLNDWTNDDDDVNGYYEAQKPQRGGRKAKRRKQQHGEGSKGPDWDEIYDPTRPNNPFDYKRSDEKYREIRDWKDFLHRADRRPASSGSSDRPGLGTQASRNYNFAPPPLDEGVTKTMSGHEDMQNKVATADGSNGETSRQASTKPEFMDVSADITGDDAYARRMRMSGTASTLPLPGNSGVGPQPQVGLDYNRPPHALPPGPSPMLSRLPTNSAAAASGPSLARFELPDAPSDILKDANIDSEQVHSNSINDAMPSTRRPGREDFAVRMLKKQGWVQGQGLGASGTGIVTALKATVGKGAMGVGKISGGAKSAATKALEKEELEKYGVMSPVIVLRGFVDGLDLDREMNEGNLMQRIGDQCGEKYGKIERIFIDRYATGQTPVFLKFAHDMYAVKAVTALEGSIGLTNQKVHAKFYDSEKFERGDYSHAFQASR